MLPKRQSVPAGFTLIEVLVVVALVALLVGSVAFNMSDSRAVGRDAERQANLRAMQNAIELYKQRWGRYPEGCRAGGTLWSGQPGTAFQCDGGDPRYILGSTVPINRPFSDFMMRLPIDKKVPTDPVFQNKVGYAYITNADGTVYKLMAMNTVESERVDYYHPLKSCDVIPNPGSTPPGRAFENSSTDESGPSEAGWCARVFFNAVVQTDGIPNNPGTGAYRIHNRCRMSDNESGAGHDDTFFHRDMDRFDRSYGVWGGFAPDPIAFTNFIQRIRNTTAVICK